MSNSDVKLMRIYMDAIFDTLNDLDADAAIGTAALMTCAVSMSYSDGVDRDAFIKAVNTTFDVFENRKD